MPLLGYPAAPGQGQPHICRVPGGCTARNRSLFLCQEEQERGQHAVSPGYFVSSHRQRKLTGSSNPLCWYPEMTEHQHRKEKKKKKVIIEDTQQAAGLVPETTIRKGSIGTNRACACLLSGSKCCLYLHLCCVPSAEGGNVPWNGVCYRYNVGRQSPHQACNINMFRVDYL